MSTIFRRTVVSARIVMPMLVLHAMAAGLFAQYGQQQQGAKPQPISATGEMKGWRGTTMMVQAGPAGYFVNLNEKTKVHVNGSAKADFLGPNMFVTFTTKVNKSGEVAEPVKSLKMLTPSEVIVAGTQEDGAAEGDLTPQYFAGYIRTKKQDKLTLQYGKSPKESVTFTVADDAEISVELVGDARNARLAREGDEVKVIGKGVQPMNNGPGLALAEELTITLAEPLTNAKRGK